MTPDPAAVEIRQRLRAPPQTVFAAFAEARLVSRWLTPSPDIDLHVETFEFRVGGAYRFDYHLPDGAVVVVRGAFRTIVPPSRIVFSWTIDPPDEHAGIDSEVTVTIAPERDGTLLVIRHARLAMPGAAARHAQGWRGTLDRLTALLATPAASDGR
jgi:uncharacterized protein YndB with AHSA1/START domain